MISIVNTKVPAPSYIEEKGKKKVAPIGFVPNGATYQIILVRVRPVGLEPTTCGLKVRSSTN